MSPRIWTGILSIAFIVAGCGDDAKPSSGSGVSCGPGTVQRDGACVPESQAGLECGEGTVEEDGLCVPETETALECGEPPFLHARELMLHTQYAPNLGQTLPHALNPSPAKRRTRR